MPVALAFPVVGNALMEALAEVLDVGLRREGQCAAVLKRCIYSVTQFSLKNLSPGTGPPGPHGFDTGVVPGTSTRTVCSSPSSSYKKWNMVVTTLFHNKQ